MKKKEFLKISLGKIVLMIILIIVMVLISILAIYSLKCNLQTKIICNVWEFVEKLFTLPSTILGMLNILPTIIKSKLIAIIVALVILIIDIVYWYILSCLIVFLYNKIKIKKSK